METLHVYCRKTDQLKPKHVTLNSGDQVMWSNLQGTIYITHNIFIHFISLHPSFIQAFRSILRDGQDQGILRFRFCYSNSLHDPRY